MPEPPVLLIEVACQHFATLFLCALCLLPPLWQPINPPSRVNLGVWWPFLGRLQVRVRQTSGLPRGWFPHFLLDLVVRPQPAKKRTASLANDLSMSRSCPRYFSKCPLTESIQIPQLPSNNHLPKLPRNFKDTALKAFTSCLLPFGMTLSFIGHGRKSVEIQFVCRLLALEICSLLLKLCWWTVWCPA